MECPLDSSMGALAWKFPILLDFWSLPLPFAMEVLDFYSSKFEPVIFQIFMCKLAYSHRSYQKIPRVWEAGSQELWVKTIWMTMYVFLVNQNVAWDKCKTTLTKVETVISVHCWCSNIFSWQHTYTQDPKHGLQT